MFIVKSENGIIKIAHVAKAKLEADYAVPGVVDTWYPLGPGEDPYIVRYTSTQLVLVFTYLSHSFCRVLDTSIWPPSIVDPTTYTPQISVQRILDSPSIHSQTLTGTSQTGMSLDEIVKLLPVSSTYTLDVDTGILSISLSRDNAFTPTITPLHGYKLWEKDYSSSTWSLLSDYQTDFINYPYGHVGAFHKMFALSYGGFFDPAFPNASDKFLESVIGPTITVDTSTMSKLVTKNLSDTFQIDLNPTTSSCSFTSSPNFLFYISEDSFSISYSNTTGISSVEGTPEFRVWAYSDSVSISISETTSSTFVF